MVMSVMRGLAIVVIGAVPGPGRFYRMAVGAASAGGRVWMTEK